MEIHLNMYQTLAVAVLVLLFGNFFKTPHWVSGKILYSGTCHWRSFVCNFDLSLLCYRNCGIFF